MAGETVLFNAPLCLISQVVCSEPILSPVNPTMQQGSCSRTFYDMLRDSLASVERFRHDESVTKQDVLDSMENYLSNMLKKMIATPTATSYCVFRTD